jgi:hypothetical protein
VHFPLYLPAHNNAADVTSSGLPGLCIGIGLGTRFAGVKQLICVSSARHCIPLLNIDNK